MDTPENEIDSGTVSGRTQRLVRHLDLFSGIGGFALAAQWVGGIETVGFCEIEPWAQKVLNKNFPNVPIHGDIKTLDPKNYGPIDLITGGYPCQPFSSIGKKKGKEDSRHLWPQMFSVIKRSRPSWVLAENVAGHVTMGLDAVCCDLENEGYTTRSIVIPACAVGAPHQRDRVWLVAHSASEREQRIMAKRGRETAKDEGSGGHPNGELIRGNTRSTEGGWKNQWALEPRMDRVVDGVSRRVDRLRGLGNAIVPQVVAEILRCMMSVDSYLPNVKLNGERKD